MRYYQVLFPNGDSHLAAETSEDSLVDLTSISTHARSVYDLLQAASLTGTTADRVAQALIDRRGTAWLSLSDLERNSASESKGPRLTLPLAPPEIWAVGVTYQDSMRERQAESKSPDIYAKVYGAERPEIFFKGTPRVLAEPFGEVGIRADSPWNVPEPELAFVLYDGRIAGYTCGNDMSSRTIEGENPLYLPQAKIYDRSCAIGPCFATAETVGDPQTLTVSLTIERGGKQAFKGSTNTGKMRRNCDYLADWLQRHNPVPDGTTVCTGTGTIPPPEFTLQQGDIIRIEIEKIGTLVNTVVVV
ncbi:MAG: fumarylacetoacetate hydrolase family protein [Chloroflexi bacterium]|nr:fumarylacetoacetate hydrolase family protein [Chloroflexota bacterium]